MSTQKESGARSHTEGVAQRYDLAAVRDLLFAAFDAVDFRRLFLYTADHRLRLLIHEFSPADGLADMVDEAVEFCLTRGLFEALLAEVERLRPDQYTAFAPRLIAAGGQTDGDAGHGALQAMEALLTGEDEQSVQVTRETIANRVVVLGPEGVDALARVLMERAGVSRAVVQEPGAVPDQEVANQIGEAVAAQKAVAAHGVGLTAQAAYHFGLLAAYQRDYDQALEYFHTAGESDPEFSDAFESIAWLQHTLASQARRQGARDEAEKRLVAAREAAEHADPLDPNTLALRGYIAKTLAELAEMRSDVPARTRYYTEAARFFEHVVRLDPENASAANGLGNVLHAAGDLDGAISSYRRAIELQPGYTAAYHDLAGAYEARMSQDPARRVAWCQQAVEALRKAYELAPLDPGFPADYVVVLGQRLARLQQECR